MLQKLTILSHKVQCRKGSIMQLQLHNYICTVVCTYFIVQLLYIPIVHSISYELTAYKQVLQLICLYKPLIKPLA